MTHVARTKDTVWQLAIFTPKQIVFKVIILYSTAKASTGQGHSITVDGSWPRWLQMLGCLPELSEKPSALTQAEGLDVAFATRFASSWMGIGSMSCNPLRQVVLVDQAQEDALVQVIKDGVQLFGTGGFIVPATGDVGHMCQQLAIGLRPETDGVDHNPLVTGSSVNQTTHSRALR